MTNKELYRDLPKLSQKIRERRVHFAGHCFRNKNEPVSRLIHWIPKHGRRKPGTPSLTYVDVLKQDTALETSEVQTAMQDALEGHSSLRTPLDISQVSQARFSTWVAC